ncbi:hypothetical protein EVL38_11620 [Salmonella enterica]|nr:hypothetical protein [Salmonella enterica]
MLSALFLNFIREVQKCQGTCIYIYCDAHHKYRRISFHLLGNDSNLLIVFYVQIMPDDFVMQLHRF